MAHTTTLKEAAALAGVRFGGEPWDSGYTPATLTLPGTLAVAHCDWLVPRGSWTFTQVTRGGAISGSSDLGTIAFAAANGLLLTGQHLLWHNNLPDWFTANTDPAQMRADITDWITKLGANRASVTASINVCNEIILPSDGRGDGLRTSALTTVLGSTFVDYAFRAARTAFPTSLLVLNDYGMEESGADRDTKRSALLALLDTVLLPAATPIDAIGFQAHLRLSNTFDATDFGAFLDQIIARGLKVCVTELDVRDDTLTNGTAAARDAAVAARMRAFLRCVLARKAHVSSVTTWGLTDLTTWLTGQYTRPDGQLLRPLPFDRFGLEKPVWTEMMQALAAA